MRKGHLLAAAIGLGSVLFAGCSETPCDRSDKFDPASRTGDCQVQVQNKVLGPTSSCQGALSSCSDADRDILNGIVSCFENLPVCAAGNELGWAGQVAGCYAPAQNLSQGCRDGVFASGIPGGEDDGGEDAGVVDAGYPPDTEDGGALDLFLAADETQIALAWTQSQPGDVDHWDVIGFSAADVREAPIAVSDQRYSTQEVGAGVKKKYFVLGINAAGEVVMGEVDGGTASTDAGTAMCTGPLDCPVDQICNLGSCQTQPCQNSNVCPAGYLCDVVQSMVCERQFGFGDGGTPDAGTQDAGTGPTAPRPFVSELQEITTAPPTFSAERVVTTFVAENPDVAAMDTARQFVIMDQEAQVFGYYTENRGRSWRSVPIDPVGQRPRIAWEPQSRTLFACYNAVGGVRLRRSTDMGRTWGTQAHDLVNQAPSDGGVAEVISDCDIAPWTNGSALVIAKEGDLVKLWTVTQDLAVTGPDTVFASSTTYTNPRELVIATLPSDFLVHVAFTAQRPLTTGGNDTEILGMFRSQGSAFVGPRPLHNTPNPFPQSAPTLAIDPVTKRAVGAFVSREGSPTVETVYMTMWSDQAMQWASGSDLNVFVMNQQASAYLVVTDRTPGETWAARTPSLVVTPAGKIVLGFAAGEEIGGFPVFKAYSVGFDLEKPSPLAQNAKGWFLEPAVKASDTRIFRTTQQGDVAGPVLAADSQISVYYVLIEGVGSTGETANRAVMLSRPR